MTDSVLILTEKEILRRIIPATRSAPIPDLRSTIVEVVERVGDLGSDSFGVSGKIGEAGEVPALEGVTVKGVEGAGQRIVRAESIFSSVL